jgi:hypothetical protein
MPPRPRTEVGWSRNVITRGFLARSIRLAGGPTSARDGEWRQYKEGLDPRWEMQNTTKRAWGRQNRNRGGTQSVIITMR